ncbi:MAG: SCP2 sterol-binding domain-containing protein [Actinomycetota bacterium]
MVTYLSTEWLDRVRELATVDEALSAASQGVELTLQQVVTDTPHGDVRYYVTFDDGDVYVQAGDVTEPDVTFTQDYRTAVGVATGELGALDALRDGRVVLTGDPTALQDRAAVLGALDTVFGQVREETTYPERERR